MIQLELNGVVQRYGKQTVVAGVNLRLASGHMLMAHVPSHHDHKVGEWIGIRAEVDHVVTFNRACPVQGRELCQMPCTAEPGTA